MAARYSIGFEIVGHVVVTANNAQAAAAEAGGLVRAAVRAVQGGDKPTSGSNVEYRCPSGDIIVAGKSRIRTRMKR